MSARRDRRRPLAVGGYRLGWRARAARCRSGRHTALFDRIADVAVAPGRQGRAAAARQLRAGPPRARAAALDALVRAGMRSYMRYYCEAFRLPDRTPRTRSSGPCASWATTPSAPSSAAGRGRSSCFLGHLGNWDLAGGLGSRQPRPRRHRGRAAQARGGVCQEFLAFRESLGMTIIPLTGGGDVFAQLRGHLTARRCVMPLLADRDLTDARRRGRPLRPPARMAAGPAALSLLTGAALHPRVDPLRAALDGSGLAAPDRHHVPRPGRGARRGHDPRQGATA